MVRYDNSTKNWKMTKYRKCSKNCLMEMPAIIWRRMKMTSPYGNIVLCLVLHPSMVSDLLKEAWRKRYRYAKTEFRDKIWRKSWKYVSVELTDERPFSNSRQRLCVCQQIYLVIWSCPLLKWISIHACRFPYGNHMREKSIFQSIRKIVFTS